MATLTREQAAKYSDSPLTVEEYMIMFGEPDRHHAQDMIEEKHNFPNYWRIYYALWVQVNEEYTFECVNGGSKRVPILRNGRPA